MNISKILLPVCLSLSACSAKPSLVAQSNSVGSDSDRQLQSQICEQKFEDYNQIYLLAEPLYGVDRCAADIRDDVFILLFSLRKTQISEPICDQIENVEDVLDPVVDYSKRSIVFISNYLDSLEAQAFSVNISHRNMFPQLKTCFLQIEEIFHSYTMFGYDFGIDPVVFSYLNAKLDSVEKQLYTTNYMFCLY
jgi:hypothetical protein